MKKFKIILWLIIFLWIGWISYGRDECVTDSQCWEWMRCSGWSCIVSITEPNIPSDNPSEWTSNQSNDECTKDSDCNNWICQQDWNKKVCVENLYWDAGININKDCLLNWQCSMNVPKTLWIRKSNPDPSVKVFAQDIILWASMFFGTIMTVLLIVSGLSYVMAWYTGKSPDKAKKMMVWSIIWLLFVTFSYTIIRLIQFLATWWS